MASVVVSHSWMSAPRVVSSERCSLCMTKTPRLLLNRRTTSTKRGPALSVLSNSITSPATTKGWSCRRCDTTGSDWLRRGTRVTTASLATQSVSAGHTESSNPSAMLTLCTRAAQPPADTEAMLAQSICATLTDSCHSRALYSVMASPFCPATCRPMQKGKQDTSPTHAPLPTPLPTQSGCT